MGLHEFPQGFFVKGTEMLPSMKRLAAMRAGKRGLLKVFGVGGGYHDGAALGVGESDHLFQNRIQIRFIQMLQNFH